MKTNNNLFSFLVKEREYKKKATLFINLDKESYRFMRMIVWFFHQELYRPKFAVLMATIQRMYKTNGAKFTVSY
jgi:Fe-S oxidoreductase